MKMAGKILYISTVTMGALSGCIKPYMPPSTTANANVLVVDGLINTADSTIILLSRTVIITNKTTANPETKATITIENATSTVYTLTETVKGTYVTPALTLDNTQQYRLRIKTSNGQTYLSDLVPARVTPPIDSVGSNVLPDGLQIYVNTHDATNNTRYYKYKYQETWQYRSAFNSYYVSNGLSLNLRTPAQYVQYCFGNDFSSNVIVNSTITLSQDLVYQFPIAVIDSGSEKLETKYSILVTQQALTSGAYTYWQDLKSDTEDLGTIFDALPSQLFGNIHNINNAAEPVIGYISAGTLQKKRIFITNAQVPQTWTAEYFAACASQIYLDYGGDPSFLIPLPNPDVYIQPGNPFVYTTDLCGDCTAQGGSVTQPSFWK